MTPLEPRRLCSVCGLRATRRRTCSRCREAGRRARETRQARGYGVDHQRWRDGVLEADPICKWPSGCTPPSVDVDEGPLCWRSATVADHVIPWLLDPDVLKLDLRNGQGLCPEHHGTKSALEDRGLYLDTVSGAIFTRQAVGIAGAHEVLKEVQRRRKGRA